MTRRSDVVFSPAVREAQRQRGARTRRDFERDLTEALVAFVRARDSFYLATASADGQPYVQHRGGPIGFLEVRDPRTLSFADYPGNQQYVTVGNLSENPRVCLFLMDYAARRRLKIWGRGVVSERPGAHRQITVHIDAWDLNCPKHIPPRARASTHVRLVCLDISDPVAYGRYRTEMAPILARHGGHFVLDVEGVAHVHPAPFDAGRVLLLAFPSAGAAAAFYADPAYQAVRATWFEPAVARTWAGALEG